MKAPSESFVGARVIVGARVMAEYRVYAGVVTIEVDTQTGLQLLELNTSEARELQLALVMLLGPALGDAAAVPVYDQAAESDTVTLAGGTE